MVAYKKVNLILSAAVLLVAGGRVLASDTSPADDEDHLITVLKTPHLTPEQKDEVLAGYANQNLVLHFSSLSAKNPVRHYADMCRPSVAKCCIDCLAGARDPLPAQVVPEIKEYANYCRMTKQRQYCRDNFDRLARSLMDRFDQDERLLLTALLRHYKQAKASGEATVAPIPRARKFIIDAYIELMRSKFGDSNVQPGKEMQLLDRVAGALGKFDYIYALFNFLTLKGEPRLESKEKTNILVIEWRTVGEIAEGFRRGVYRYFYSKIKPRLERRGFFDRFLAQPEGPSTVSRYEQAN